MRFHLRTLLLAPLLSLVSPLPLPGQPSPKRLQSAQMADAEALWDVFCTDLRMSSREDVGTVGNGLLSRGHVGLAYLVDGERKALCAVLRDPARLARLRQADSVVGPLIPALERDAGAVLLPLPDSVLAVIRAAAAVYGEEWGVDTIRPVHRSQANDFYVSLLFVLGHTADEHGNFAVAEELFAKVLQIRDAAPGTSRDDLLLALRDLARVLSRQGKFGTARSLRERFIAMTEGGNARDRRLATIELNELALTLFKHGDFEAAIPMLRRVLAKIDSLPNFSGEDRATVMGNLAAALDQVGEPAEARALLHRSIPILEADGSEPDVLAGQLETLSWIHQGDGDLKEARRLAERSLQILSVLPDLNARAVSMNNLADVLGRLGDDAAARSYLEQALVLMDSAVGPGNFERIETMLNLGGVLLRQRDAAAARTLVIQATDLLNRHTRQALPLLTPAEQRLMLGRVFYLQATSLLLELCIRDAAACADAYARLAEQKGLLLEELRRQTLITALESRPEYSPIIAGLRELRAELTRWQQAPPPVPPAHRRAAADSLAREKERLERRLAAALPADALDDTLRSLGLAGLQARLPDDAALVDFYVHGRLLARGYTLIGYSAVVVTRTGAPRVVPLERATTLDSLVARWQEDVAAGRDGAEAEYELLEIAWGPIARVLPPGTRRVWVSPDGELSRLPWNLLAERYLGTEALLVAHTASPRALAQQLSTPPPAGPMSMLLVGGVAFGAPPPGQRPSWAPLPGSRAEVAAIASLAAGARLVPEVLADSAANPAMVQAALQRARFSHLATHGFVSHSPPPRGPAGYVTSAQPSRTLLVESGVALAGANAGPSGLLTAEQLLGLDLSGTQLMVLSACDTGRGMGMTGQGVLGLRASIGAAGARTLLLSLWKVPDESTALLMRHFYSGLWEESLAPAEALRRAQAAVRRDTRFAAPLFWAAWVLDGEGWPAGGVAP
jgi:CHAT domain-containing protein/tetratricopeptide (TPR) repeat protein